jgi:hypothetical protein
MELTCNTISTLNFIFMSFCAASSRIKLAACSFHTYTSIFPCNLIKATKYCCLITLKLKMQYNNYGIALNMASPDLLVSL